MDLDKYRVYLKSHFFDTDRLDNIRRKFPDLIEKEGFLSYFINNPLPDIAKENDIFHVITNQYSIPHHIYTMMFPKCTYTFPWLEKDADGHIKNKEPHQAKYADYSFFDTVGIVCYDPHVFVRDPELEDCLKDVLNVEIDLRKEPTDGLLYMTNQCWIFPKSIRGTPAYDVLYYADYLFKFFFRGFERVILRGKPYYSVGTDDFLISRIPAEDGFHHTIRADKLDGFIGLRNIIHLFSLNNKEKLAGWREAHVRYGRRTFIANLQFPNIEYGQDDQGIYIAPLKPNIQIQELDGTTPPENSPASVFKLFIESSYEAIKKSFPIYERLERLYKIILRNQIMSGKHVEPCSQEKNELVYIENHQDSIACHGGIKLQPQIWTPVVIPQRKFIQPPPQVSLSSNDVVNVKVARRPLEHAPLATGSVAHSALILETRNGRRMLLEYLGDSQVHMKDFQPDGYDWKVQEQGQALDRQMTPDEIQSIMESQVRPGKYNIHEWNCHMAQEKTRRAIGLKVDTPYNPLW